MKLSNKAYDIIKWLSMILFDAIGVLYKTLSAVWGWPYGDEVMATCAAISVFLGAIIGISTAQYNAEKESAEE